MKIKKTLFAALAVSVLLCSTAFAGTSIESYGGDYGTAELDVSYSSGMRSSYAWTGSNSPINYDYTYKINLDTTYSDGSESRETVGYNQGYACIDNSTSYEWAEDYSSQNYVRVNGIIEGRIFLYED